MKYSVLDEWRLWQEAQGLSNRTITERIATIRNMLTYTDADEIRFGPRDIMSFCGRPGLTSTSRATYHTSIRAYCRWLILVDLRDDDPTRKTLPPKRAKAKPRPITDDQLDALLAQANRRRTKTYILLATLAGLRVHEIAKIRGEDFAGDRVTVKGKGNSTWTVPLHPRLIEEAARYPAEGYWFRAYEAQTDAEHVRSHAVSKAIHDAMLRAGFHGKPHQLRHWFGTALVSRGVDLGVVQKLMRHESPATTVIYADIRFGLQSEGLSRLNLPAA